MDPTTQPSSEEVRTAAAATIAPNPDTAALLEKHSAGEKLTSSEYGKIGAWAKVRNAIFRPTLGQPRETVETVQAEREDKDFLHPDPRIVQRTTASLLKSADTLARRWVGREARRAGADDKALARFDSAAAFPLATQEMIADLSPDLLASLGLDPKNYPWTVAIGALGLWGSNIWLIVDEIKTMQAERQQPKPQATGASQPGASQLQVVK